MFGDLPDELWKFRPATIHSGRLQQGYVALCLVLMALRNVKFRSIACSNGYTDTHPVQRQPGAEVVARLFLRACSSDPHPLLCLSKQRNKNRRGFTHAAFQKGHQA